jgi:hypothetical protein
MYELQQDSGRLSVPYVMLYYLPITCNAEVKMLYAGAKELMRNTAEVNRIIEIDSAEEVEAIEEKLKGDAWGREGGEWRLWMGNEGDGYRSAYAKDIHCLERKHRREYGPRNEMT